MVDFPRRAIHPAISGHVEIERRRRPKAPSFAGTPLSKHRSGEESRSATIVMAYFHPWTLRTEDSEEHVPFAGQLRNSDETWQGALCRWLDGRILCEEARRYVGNFLPVHLVRPAVEGSDVGDVISDEELIFLV